MAHFRIAQDSAPVIQITFLDGKRAVPDEAHASSRTIQEAFLLGRGFQPVAYGFTDDHSRHDSVIMSGLQMNLEGFIRERYPSPP